MANKAERLAKIAKKAREQQAKEMEENIESGIKSLMEAFEVSARRGDYQHNIEMAQPEFEYARSLTGKQMLVEEGFTVTERGMYITVTWEELTVAPEVQPAAQPEPEVSESEEPAVEPVTGDESAPATDAVATDESSDASEGDVSETEVPQTEVTESETPSTEEPNTDEEAVAPTQEADAGMGEPEVAAPVDIGNGISLITNSDGTGTLIETETGNQIDIEKTDIDPASLTDAEGNPLEITKPDSEAVNEELDESEEIGEPTSEASKPKRSRKK